MVDNQKLCSVLVALAESLLTEFPLHAILDRLVASTVELLPITSAGVTLVGLDQHPHMLAASDPIALQFEQLQSDTDHGPGVTAHHAREAVAVPDLSFDDRFPQFGPVAVAAGVRAVFALPLRHDGGCIGSLDLYSDTAGFLSQEDWVVAQALADVATSYLLNARSRDEVRAARDEFLHSSLHDALTRLPNRRLLQDRIEQASRRAQRSATTAAVVFVDLDRFKVVNDTYGHRSGDALLYAVARRLEGVVRPGDTLARLSGDEFVFFFDDLQDEADAERLIRRIRDAFGEPFSLEGSDVAFVIHASVGMSCAGPGEPISQLLIEEADRAMYQVKRARRDPDDLSGDKYGASDSLDPVLDLRGTRSKLPPLDVE